jgi:hypothetical protein
MNNDEIRRISFCQNSKEIYVRENIRGRLRNRGRVKVRERDQKSKRKIYSPINLPKNKEK